MHNLKMVNISGRNM